MTRESSIDSYSLPPSLPLSCSLSLLTQLMLSGFEALAQQYTQQLQQDNQASASGCVEKAQAEGGASDCFVTELEAQAETVALGKAGVLEHLHEIRKNRVRAVQIGNGTGAVHALLRHDGVLFLTILGNLNSRL